MRQSDWFPLTKLQPPQLSGAILNRPRLVERLYRAVTGHRLTLLSAPAGSGKTTALIALRQCYPDLPLAWVTLDAADNDPGSFLTLVLAALQRLDPAWINHASPLLASLPDDGTQVKRVLAVLINDILAAEPPPFGLVLDDLHLISDSTIYDGLAYLLDHMPPAMHLVVMTRHDPPLGLPRLRARQQLAEFRADALSFSGAELGDWLNGLLHLGLSPETLVLVEQRTEGWVASLRLLSLSLEQIGSPEERAQLIDHFARSQRFIFDYLVDEVMNHLEPELRTFLLETSILTELTPDLCRAVTGRQDASAVLDELYRRNLFIVMNIARSGRLEVEPSYRYHALFAQFLQRQLNRKMPGRIKSLHQAAAAAAVYPAQQIYHYLAAGQWPEAATIIEALGRQQLDQGFIREQVVGWIKRLPESVQAERPWLQLVRGALYVQQGNGEAARPYLENALAGFKAAGPESGEILTLIHIQARQGGLANLEIIEEIKPRLQARPELVTPLHRVYFYIGAAWIYEYRYQWPQVEENLLAALEITQNSGELGCFQILAQSIGPQFLFIDRGMAPVERYARATLARFGEGEGPVQMGAYCQLAPALFYQGRLDEAYQAAQKAQKIGELLGQFAWMSFVLDFVLASVMMARAEYEAAAQYLRAQRMKLAGVDTYRTTQAGYLYTEGRALWLQGKLEPARQVWQQIPAYIFIKEHQVVEAMARGLMARAEKRYNAAEEHYRQAIAWQEEIRHTALSSSAGLGLAQLYLAANREREALATVKPVLNTLKQRGMPGAVLQEGPAVIPLLELAATPDLQAGFVRQVLDLFDRQQTRSTCPEPDHSALAEGEEVLSPRELEVLAQIAEGLTNREIAQRLVIAPSTVKRHTINIYNKLAVSNRTQAVSRARELGLL